MNDDPKINKRPVTLGNSSLSNGTSAGSDSQANNPAPGFTTNDVPPPEFGDKPLESSRVRVRHPMSDHAGAQDASVGTNESPDEDAGEGHKGPRVDVTRVPSDHDSQHEHPSGSNPQASPLHANRPGQPDQQAPKPMQKDDHGKSGNDGCNSAAQVEEGQVRRQSESASNA